MVGQGVEDRRLAAHSVGVDISASVDVGAAIEEAAGGVQKAVFGGDVEKRRATQGEQVAARVSAGVELGVATVDQ